MDVIEINPVLKFTGESSVPGDKSISHRLAMIGSIAEGATTIENFAPSADCQATLGCLQRLGTAIRRDGPTVYIEGRGLSGLCKPLDQLDAENSGTTVRLMSGILAGSTFDSVFVGDASLSRRPMKRIIEPLRRFGARLEAREDNYLPLRIHGASLTGIDYVLPVASAQVKSAVLLAGLLARGKTHVYENLPTRNHTEIALGQFGADIQVAHGSIQIAGGKPLKGRTFTVPGDLSSAAFLIAGALGTPGSQIHIRGVGLNPTRSGLLHLLQDAGARITVRSLSTDGGELAGDVTVEGSEIAAIEISEDLVPYVIDEIPVLAVLGTRTRNGARIRGAAELRTKESDRIRSVAENLQVLGVEVDEFPDGLFVPGNQVLRGGRVDSFGDHRIAMAFAIAGCFATRPVQIDNASCVGVSFPGFFELLETVVQRR